MILATKARQIRLTPITKLKIISFCLGMMFWYGIEQLFIDNVIGDSSARAWITFVFTGTVLIFDIPGGIIADKYGRKRSLLAGTVLVFLGVGLLGISQTLASYLTGFFIYGIYWSLTSGTIQAMVYDHLKSTERHSEYAKHQGSIYAYGYLGAAIANVLGGIIATYGGLHLPYFISLVPIFLAFWMTVKLPTDNLPEIIKATKKIKPISTYLSALLQTIRKTPIASIYALQIVFGLFIFMTICEFGQVFLLSYTKSAFVLGLLWAVVALVVAAGLQLAHRLQKYAWQSVIIFAGILITFSFIQSPLAIALFMIVYAGTEIIHNISETELQHLTASRSRATVLSTVNFFGNFVALGVIWIFNSNLQAGDIHTANASIAVSMAVLFILSGIVIFLSKYRRNRLKDISSIPV